MTPQNLVIAGIGAGCLFLFIASFSQKYHAAAARAIGKSVGLEVPSDLVEIIGRVSARRMRAAAAGGAVAFGLDVALLRLYPPDASAAGFYIFAGIFFFGVSVGVSLANVGLGSAKSRPDIRFARASAVTVSNFVPRMTRVLLWAGAALSVVLAVLLLGVEATSGQRPSSSAIILTFMAAICVAGAIVFEVFSRRIVARAQSARSESEMIWDDALRADRIDYLLKTPLPIQWFTGFTALNALGNASSGRPLVSAAMIVLLGVGCVIVVLWIVALGRGTQREYLRTLWPDRAHRYEKSVAPKLYWDEVAEHEALNNRRRLKREAAKKEAALTGKAAAR